MQIKPKANDWTRSLEKSIRNTKKPHIYHSATCQSKGSLWRRINEEAYRSTVSLKRTLGIQGGGGVYKHSSNYTLMFTIKPKDAVTVRWVTLQVKWKILVKKKIIINQGQILLALTGKYHWHSSGSVCLAVTVWTTVRKWCSRGRN